MRRAVLLRDTDDGVHHARHATLWRTSTIGVVVMIIVGVLHATSVVVVVVVASAAIAVPRVLMLLHASLSLTRCCCCRRHRVATRGKKRRGYKRGEKNKIQKNLSRYFCIN
jgi:hypothetical protein